jgi:hypothetical protein
MNDRHSRREFMGVAAVGVAGVLARPWLGDARTVFALLTGNADPDLVVFNAKVYTVDYLGSAGRGVRG